MMRSRFPFAAAVLALLSITLPFALAYFVEGANHVFMGFLLNPADGASYLAKMQLGFAGQWRFVLPYTAQASPGAYLFLFYIFLGHAARVLHLDLLLVFHVARLLSAACLLWTIFQAARITFANRPGHQRFVFWLLAFGGGMGWTVVFLGALPLDFWVAEAYPFLAMFSNPHFPLGLAILLQIMPWLVQPVHPARLAGIFALGGLLAIILPFAQVIAILVGALVAAWGWLSERKLEPRPLLALGALGGPLLLYQYAATLADPLLAGWNRQNITPTPPLWNVLLSFSPVLLLALLAVVVLLRERVRPEPARRVWLAWAAAALGLAYLPWELQRRFLLGWYLPLGFLAVDGLFWLRGRLAEVQPRLERWLAPLALALALPSTALLLLIALAGAAAHSPLLYRTRAEVQALCWLAENTPTDAVILAPPAVSTWIPALSGRRVVYGHPFETVAADAALAQVERFFAQPGWTEIHQDIIETYGVDCVLLDSAGLVNTAGVDPGVFVPVWEVETIRIYRVP